MHRVGIIRAGMLLLALALAASPRAAASALALCPEYLGYLEPEAPDSRPPHFRTLTEVVRGYLNLPPVTSRRQNAAFRRSFTREDPSTASVHEILFPIVSLLNREFGSKEPTAALFNLYKSILERRLRADPLLTGAIRSIREEMDLRYGDYKSIAIALGETSPEIQRRLADVREGAAEEFFQAVRNIPEIASLRESGRSILRNPRAWFHWGAGRTGLEAWHAVRAGRFLSPADGHMDLLEYSSPDVRRILQQRLEETEQLRGRVTRELLRLQTEQGASDMLHRSGRDRPWIPSEHLWSLFRNVVANGEDGYVAEVQRRIRHVFHVDVSRALVLDMQAYVHALELLQPRIFQGREQMSLGVSTASGPVFYFDVVGQTARNWRRAADELSRIAAAPESQRLLQLEAAIEALHEGQVIESRAFVRIKRRLRRAFRLTGIPGRWVESGDEMSFLLERSLTTGEVRSLLTTLGEAGVYGHYRPILVNPTEVRNAQGQLVRTFWPEGRHVVDGERIEKNLRWALRSSNRVSLAEWNNLMIGVEVRPLEEGGDVHLYLMERNGARLNARILPWVRSLLANPATARDILPPGYRFIGLSTSRAGD